MTRTCLGRPTLEERDERDGEGWWVDGVLGWKKAFGVVLAGEPSLDGARAL